MSFASRLTELREAAGLTAYALGKRAGMSRQAVGRLEAGQYQPSLEAAQKLAKALGVTCEAFTEDVEIPEPTPARGRGRPRKDAAPAEEQAPAPPPAKKPRGKKKPQ